MADNWLVEEVCSGLQRLITLSLPGQPAMETVELTATAWMEALSTREWSEALDRLRVRKAFNQLMIDVDRWPTPRQLIDRLPLRAEPPALPRPVYDPDKAIRNLDQIRAMLNGAVKRIPK